MSGVPGAGPLIRIVRGEMRTRSKIGIGFLGACACGLLALVVSHVTSSPSEILKDDLNIGSLPSTVSNLRMGSDQWQDVMHCFHFRLNPSDFPKLLAGRDFHTVSYGAPVETETLHITPVRHLTCSKFYEWKKPPKECMIYISDAQDEAIVRYSVRLTSP